MKRIYISGAITGTTDYMVRFEKAEQKLKAQGFEVINPAKLCSSLPTLEHKQYMELCMIALSFCNHIYVLKGWEYSQGAIDEFIQADRNGYVVIKQEAEDVIA